MSVKVGKFFSACCLLFLVTGCSFQPLAAHAKEKTVFSAWIAYWDMEDGQKDLRSLEKKLSQVSYFAAYFNENDRLFVPDEILDFREKQRDEKLRYETYLTFVNDKKLSDDKAIMKDTDVLLRALATAEKQERHADEMIALAKAGGYDGVEVDYERIWRARGLDILFPQFLAVLFDKTKEQGLKLRVILEPETPFLWSPLPKGPEYVVMLYNLFGTHGDPGPKATPDFVTSTVRKMFLLPGTPGVAFSTGGCFWSSKGEKKFITQAQAQAMAKRHKAKKTRDEQSGCLVFQYEEKGVKYTVWYADEQTLRLWMSTAKDANIQHISIWRLGGNENLHRLK